MKIKNIVFAIVATAMLIAAIFIAGAKNNERIPPVAAEGLKVKIDTPTPYATSIPSFVVQVLQKHARSEVLTRTVHGVEMSAANFRVEGDDFKVDVCFQPPNGNDWIYATPVIQFGNETRVIYESTTFDRIATLQNGEKWLTTFLGNPPQIENKKIDPNSLPDYSCDTLKFHLQNAMLSRVVLKIPTINGILPEGNGCQNRDTLQSILNAKGLGIKLDCALEGYRGKITIAEKPENMNDEEARKLMGQALRVCPKIT